MDLFNLDQPIFQLVSNDTKSAFSLRHSFEGLAIFGGIGGGKSSGSARFIALKYLSKNFGGLVLTVKPGEKESWEEYCHLTGRSKDLVILEPGNNQSFNFLDYVSESSPGEEEYTENIVEVLKTVIRAGEQKDSGKSDDAFWETALDMLIFNVIDLCKLAYGRVTVQLMFDIVQTIPKEKESILNSDNDPNEFVKAFDAARQNVTQKVKKWENSLSKEQKKGFIDPSCYEIAVLEAVPEAKLFKFLDQFFCETFKNLSDKTRSIIDFAFSGFLFRLLREPVYSMFCKRASTVKPEDSLDGKIILINLPVKVYHKVGRDTQILFKYLWQRAIEKRDVKLHPRPVFLWADEAQNFLHEKDSDTQATARSSRMATVYITQNLPSYYAALGGTKGEYKVKSFLGTLATKIFHANADIETNNYASEIIGDAYFEDLSSGVTVAENFSQTQNRSLKLERLIRPESFVQLKTGGPMNRHLVEGVLHRQGDAVRNGYNHTKIVFNQLYIP